MTALLQVQELQTFYGDAQALFGWVCRLPKVSL